MPLFFSISISWLPFSFFLLQSMDWTNWAGLNEVNQWLTNCGCRQSAPVKNNPFAVTEPDFARDLWRSWYRRPLTVWKASMSWPVSNYLWPKGLIRLIRPASFLPPSAEGNCWPPGDWFTEQLRLPVQHLRIIGLIIHYDYNNDDPSIIHNMPVCKSVCLFVYRSLCLYFC